MRVLAAPHHSDYCAPQEAGVVYRCTNDGVTT